MSESGQRRCETTIIVTAMMPSADICRRAHVARDARFDGRFVVAVATTGVFCRPTCPARTPRQENACYFATPAAALAQGYRPCRRCRPHTAPALPAWTLGSDTVLRALRLIDDGYLVDRGSRDLAAAVGIGTRQLTRLFVKELGATPAALARTRRLLLAKRLLEETALNVIDVAMGAGYGSVRRFNDEFRRVFKSSPSALRRGRKVGGKADEGDAEKESSGDIVLRLALREPYRTEWVLPFLQARAIGCLESVSDGIYRRRLGNGAWVCAAPVAGALRVSIPAAAIGETADILARTRRLFDLAADPATIDGHLAAERQLAPLVRVAPGIRVPGVWDAFEGAVRAVLGQQVSVQRATELAQRLCERFGDGAFPAAETLARAEVAAIGMPGTRGAAVSEIARRVAETGDGWLKDASTLRQAFAEIRGIGPWTTEYAAMRVAGDADAFPDADWGIWKTLGVKGAAARRWAEVCRPWRAYATMHLWHSRSRPPAAQLADAGTGAGW